MIKLKSVFWDLDGTLADTELQCHRLAFNKAFDHLKLNWNWDVSSYIDLLQISGGRNRIKFYSDDHGYNISSTQIQQIHLLKQQYYNETLYTNSLKLRPGVNRLLQELYQLGVNQWIVTTSDINSVLPFIKLSIDNYKAIFSGYITSNDVSSLKPDPEAYLLALKKSGSHFENSIVIEDSINGLESAKSANLKCIITMSPWLLNYDNSYDKADLVVDHLGCKTNPSNVLLGVLDSNYIEAKTLSQILNQ